LQRKVADFNSHKAVPLKGLLEIQQTQQRSVGV
jgi:hypothetical protein